MPIWIKSHKLGSQLFVIVQPGSRNNLIVGVHGERLKIKIKSPPTEGEANLELREFLGTFLGLTKNQIHIQSGETSRQKNLIVELSPKMTLALLETVLP